MKSCEGCKYAEWQKTASGRLHPSGDGQCKFQWKAPPLPASFHWNWNPPKPAGGWINRRKDNDDHCTYYDRA